MLLINEIIFQFKKSFITALLRLEIVFILLVIVFQVNKTGTLFVIRGNSVNDQKECNK